MNRFQTAQLGFLFGAMLAAGVILYFAEDGPRAPEHVHSFGKWEAPQDLHDFNQRVRQWHTCTNCGIVEARYL